MSRQELVALGRSRKTRAFFGATKQTFLLFLSVISLHCHLLFRPFLTTEIMR